MDKLREIIVTVIVAIIVAVLLLSNADANSNNTFDGKVTKAIHTGGLVKTQKYSMWELHKYKETTLMRKYPISYAPWAGYVAVNKYVEIGQGNTYNYIQIDPVLWATLDYQAQANRASAKAILKQYKVKGTGKKAYLKIRKYIRSGKYITGVKTASGYFEQHGGDCCAVASAVYVLCRVQGIPVRWCMGGLSYGGLHAWNRVKLGKVWYWVDETFEEPMVRSLSKWDYHKKPMEMW